MHFLPISIAIFFIFLLLTPFLIFLLPAVAFSKLGLSPVAGLFFFWFSLIGSMVNFPVYRRKLDYYIEQDNMTELFNRFFELRVPAFQGEQVIALNLGGAVLPGILSIYLLSRIDPGPVILATAVTTAFSYFLSRPVKGVGITIPPFLPAVIAAVAALLFAGRGSAPAVAYISGVMGTLIGADLLRLRQIKNFGVSFLSIGGAGVFDGIFIVGIMSVLLA